MEFAGFDLTNDGYKPPERFLRAIETFPTTNLTSVRSWFGLINQVAYAFAQAPIMEPFRELLKHNSRFYWDDALDQLFKESRREINRLIKDGVKTFQVGKETCLTTDLSKSGIGFVLTQKHCSCPIVDPLCGNGHWQLVYAGSRFTTPAEQRYAPIEGEALALMFSLESCRLFMMGCPNLTVATDHKPLIRIFNNRDLHDIKNRRLLNFKERTLMYGYRIISIPGKDNAGANTMSRIPPPSTVSTLSYDDDIELSIKAAAIQQFYQPKDPPNITYEKIRAACNTDDECQSLLSLIKNGFPQRKDDIDDTVTPFWAFRHELYTINDLIYIEGRVLIPKSLRNAIVEHLHIGHQGVNSMRANAKRRFFWPGMGSQLSVRRSQCKRCNEIAPSNRKETPKSHDQPEHPFQMVVADLFHMASRTYLVYADRFTAWTEVASTAENTNGKTICNILRRYFVNFGVPEELSSDGGPPFQSGELSFFLKSWNVSHKPSSAYYAQSNGRAEAAVKHMKRILMTNIGSDGSLDIDSVAKALLLHRNTPSSDIGASPTELLFDKPIRDHLPHPRRFRREWIELADNRERALTQRLISNTKPTTRRDLDELKVGDSVAVQNQHGSHPLHWEKTGSVVEGLPNRQYRVVIDGSRRTSLRNRRFLRRIPNVARHATVDPEHLPSEQPKENDRVAREVVLPPSAETSEKTVKHEETPEQTVTPSPVSVENTTTPSLEGLRRSTRVRKIPKKFEDYILS